MPRRNPRIVLLGEFPPPPGGMAQQAELLADSLEREGCRVSRCRTNIHWSGPLRRVESFRYLRTLVKLPLIYGRFVHALGGASVCHIFSNSYVSFALFTAPALLICRGLGVRVIVNFHGGAAEAFLSSHAWWAVPLLRRADVLSVPSPYLREIFGRHYLRASVIPNLINLEQFADRPRVQGSARFIVTRHLEPVYGIDTVLRAFARIVQAVPAATLTVVGGGSQAAPLRQLRDALGLQECVRFTGQVENARLPELYAQADIFLNGSRVDNAPVAILEAFAGALPVVSTRAGGIGSLVTHGLTGLLVEIDDAEALADAALTLLHHPEQARALAANALAVARASTWSHVRLQWYEYYHLDDPAPPASASQVPPLRA
ncbi:MAG: glycosyltransferase family 4 protein [Nitrospirota bacterium]